MVSYEIKFYQRHIRNSLRRILCLENGNFHGFDYEIPIDNDDFALLEMGLK